MTTFRDRERAHRIALGSLKTAAVLFALALLAEPIAAQRQAQPRSGSSGGGSGSSSARQAPSGPSRGSSASSPSRSAGSRSAVHRDSGSSDRSSPHRPPGVDRDRDGHGHYYPHYFYPRYSFGFGFGYYSPYYYPYSPYYYPYSYGYPYYYPYYGRRWGYAMPYGYPPAGEDPYYGREELGAVALRVRPKTAEVYVDGRYLGTAGSFDGFPGYLWLEPGVYELELVNEGFANLEREIEVAAGQVLEFKLKLEKGMAERPSSDRARYPERGERAPGAGGYLPREAPVPGGAYEREPIEDARRAPARLFLDVRPDDASVYLDGRFLGTAAEVSSSRSPVVVDPGEHVIQVVHPEFASEQRELTIDAGEETRVEITLREADRI